MGKKSKSTTPGTNGTNFSGIYKPRPEKIKRKRMTAAEIDAACRALEGLEGLEVSTEDESIPQSKFVDPWRKHPTIREWFANYRKGLVESIQPHVVQDSSPQAGCSYKPLPELGEPWFRLADNLAPEVREAALDAFDAISDIRSLESHVGEDNTLTGDLAWVIQGAYNLGRAVERMQVRQFEPLVSRAKTQLVTIKKINAEKLNESGNLKQKALEAIEQAKRENPDRADDKNTIKIKAAEILGIGKRALNTRLSK